MPNSKLRLSSPYAETRAGEVGAAKVHRAGVDDGRLGVEARTPADSEIPGQGTFSLRIAAELGVPAWSRRISTPRPASLRKTSTIDAARRVCDSGTSMALKSAVKMSMLVMAEQMPSRTTRE